MRPARVSIRVLIVLAIAQIIGWGSVGLTAVVAPLVAADLGMDLAAVFAGNSLFYATMGISAPILGRAFVRYGARTVMIAGSALAGPGFVGLALAVGPVSYFAAWIVLGVAGGATLTNLAGTLTAFGPDAVLLLTAGCVLTAMAAFLALTRRRPTPPQPLRA